MLVPQATTTGALFCGLLALLCVGLTHASIAAAFESTPSSSFDHGGDSSSFPILPFSLRLPGLATAAAAAAEPIAGERAPPPLPSSSSSSATLPAPPGPSRVSPPRVSTTSSTSRVPTPAFLAWG